MSGEFCEECDHELETSSFDCDDCVCDCHEEDDD
jgi:hypothetical protein